MLNMLNMLNILNIKNQFFIIILILYIGVFRKLQTQSEIGSLQMISDEMQKIERFFSFRRAYIPILNFQIHHLNSNLYINFQQ